MAWRNKKIESFGYCIAQLNDYDNELLRHIEKDYYEEDVERVINLYFKNPIQAWLILKDRGEPNAIKQNHIIDSFSKGKSKIAMIIGARGSGKTATAFFIAEQLHVKQKMRVYYVGAGINTRAFPKWCIHVDKMQSVPEGVLAIVDEAGIQFNPRESWKEANVMIGKQMMIARHHGISVLFITQHAMLADKNIRRLTDIFIWKISNSYDMALGLDGNKDNFWNFVRRNLRPRKQNEILFEYPSKSKFINCNHNLPDCWSDDLSKSWKDWGKLVDKVPEIKQKDDVLDILQ